MLLCKNCTRTEEIRELEDNNKLTLEIIRILKGQQKNTAVDEYDIGFYNGIEKALSLLEKREPIFKK